MVCVSAVSAPALRATRDSTVDVPSVTTRVAALMHVSAVAVARARVDSVSVTTITRENSVKTSRSVSETVLKSCTIRSHKTWYQYYAMHNPIGA